MIILQDIPVIFVLPYKQPRRKLFSSWWWWEWPFQSALLHFGPEPQIKQTKNRLFLYPLARQGIPVIFILSYKRPRRKLSSSWWWWWWPFQSTLLPFGSASPGLDWPMLYYCIVAELSRHRFSAHCTAQLSAGGDSVVITKVSHDLTSFPNSARRFLWNVRLGLKDLVM